MGEENKRKKSSYIKQLREAIVARHSRQVIGGDLRLVPKDLRPKKDPRPAKEIISEAFERNKTTKLSKKHFVNNTGFSLVKFDDKVKVLFPGKFPDRVIQESSSLAPAYDNLKLGRGTSGKVKICQDPDTGNFSACKVISLPDDVSAESIKFEADCYKQLYGSAGFIQVRGKHDTIHYFIEMPWFKGKDLTHYKTVQRVRDALYSETPVEIEARRIIDSQDLDIAIKIIEAVQSIHKAEILHLDLKLNNIIYDEEGREVKIIDFGSARPYTETMESHPEGEYGTAGTLPREGLRLSRGVKKCARYCNKTDIYQIGWALAELLGLVVIKKNQDESPLYSLKSENDYAEGSIEREIINYLQSYVLQEDPNARASLEAMRDEFGKFYLVLQNKRSDIGENKEIVTSRDDNNENQNQDLPDQQFWLQMLEEQEKLIDEAKAMIALQLENNDCSNYATYLNKVSDSLCAVKTSLCAARLIGSVDKETVKTINVKLQWIADEQLSPDKFYKNSHGLSLFLSKLRDFITAGIYTINRALGINKDYLPRESATVNILNSRFASCSNFWAKRINKEEKKGVESKSVLSAQ